jgi:dienelactone hydrolase
MQKVEKIRSSASSVWGHAGDFTEAVERLPDVEGGKLGGDAPGQVFTDYRHRYRAEAFRDAWSRCIAWFKGTIGG